MATKSKDFLAQLDALVARHGDGNPQLKEELENLREQLVEAQKRRNAGDVARIGLQVLGWARWIFDSL